MKRWYLYPFSVIYGFITSVRNLFFNIGFLHSKKFTTPIIGIGNLSVGGTGKSPMVMYLADLLSRHHVRTGVLSRGYGRKTSGYVITNYESDYTQVGDEAIQLFQRFKNRIVIGVCEDRVAGAKKIIEDMDLEVLLLDDSYQHRYINPGFNILLTSFKDPYFNDYLLPAGDLRESRSGYRRANLIVVTKCPDNLSEAQKKQYLDKIKPLKHQKVFFSSIAYSDKVLGKTEQLPIINLKYYEVLLITGIAHPQYLERELNKYASVKEHLEFPDHHSFTDSDIKKIEEKFRKLGEYKLILTTEKDYARLKNFEYLEDKLYYWPINVEFENREQFNKAILNYVGKN